jgi:hypothetical protein
LLSVQTPDDRNLTSVPSFVTDHHSQKLGDIHSTSALGFQIPITQLLDFFPEQSSSTFETANQFG